jgi:nicotinate-nucleotide adenylyltransferase
MFDRKIIIYGGSFDPPHRSHIEGASYVCDVLGADEVVFVPFAQGTDYDEKLRIPSLGCCRLRMLSSLLQYIGHPKFKLYINEIYRQGPSYLIDVLQDVFALYNKRENVKLYFLIGSDKVDNFEEWKNFKQILILSELAIMVRPPHNLHEVREFLPKSIQRSSLIIETPTSSISSSEIRSCLAKNDFLNPLVSANVYPITQEYIKSHSLYKR